MTATAPRSSPARDLAGALAGRLLAADPFTGTGLGLREYDALVPDPSAAAEDDWPRPCRDRHPGAQTVAARTPPTRVTLATSSRATCARHASALADRGRASSRSRRCRSPGRRRCWPSSPAPCWSTRRPRPTTSTGCGARSAWIDGATQRLREGAAAGRYPGRVTCRRTPWPGSTARSPSAFPARCSRPRRPEGWAGRGDVARRARAAGREQDRAGAGRAGASCCSSCARTPAADEPAGPGALPDGAQDYATRDRRAHHAAPDGRGAAPRSGSSEVADSRSGPASWARASAWPTSPPYGPRSARRRRRSTRRSRSSRRTRPPYAGPRRGPARSCRRRCPNRARSRRCRTPWPSPAWRRTTPGPARTAAGRARTGSTPCARRPVPGGTSKRSRSTRPCPATTRSSPGCSGSTDLPLLQQFSITVHAEGWGLYAERLAGEFGLYSGVEAEIGAVYVEMHRAARLVVDTGLHAFGWSRQQARDFLLEHVALAEGVPGRRDRPLHRAGPGRRSPTSSGSARSCGCASARRPPSATAFDLPAFNGALLDSGNLPMPVLATVVRTGGPTARRPGCGRLSPARVDHQGAAAAGADRFGRGLIAAVAEGLQTGGVADPGVQRQHRAGERLEPSRRSRLELVGDRAGRERGLGVGREPRCVATPAARRSRRAATSRSRCG